MDNRFIERLWRSVKYEDIYLRDYLDGLEAGRGLHRWFVNYNELRPHQALHDARFAVLHLGSTSRYLVKPVFTTVI